MAAIQIVDGRTSLWQWDTGVKLRLFGCSLVDQMHFDTPDGVIMRELVNGECAVPDAALQTAGLLHVYAFDRTSAGGVTRHDFSILVGARPKPADYIDPPDEADIIELIAQRVAEIVGPNAGGGSIEGAIRYDVPQKLSDEQKAQARENIGIVSYNGEYSVTPSATSEVTLQTAQKLMDADVHVQKIPYFDVSNNSGGQTVYIASEV